jgi:hypothetical protein
VKTVFIDCISLLYQALDALNKLCADGSQCVVEQSPSLTLNQRKITVIYYYQVFEQPVTTKSFHDRYITYRRRAYYQITRPAIARSTSAGTVESSPTERKYIE